MSRFSSKFRSNLPDTGDNVGDERMKIELHCHSTASDGMRTPEELVAAALEKNIDVLALTDHDTVENLETVRQLCQEAGISFIPGIELSCEHQEESIHILGYFNDRDYQDPILRRRLQRFQEQRDFRALEIARRLKQHFNIEIDLSRLDPKEGSSLGRPHIAQLIHEKYGTEFQEIFKRYLGNHSKAYIPSSRIPISSGISMLKDAGATVILAHPGNYKKTSFEDLMTFGFSGAECYYATHSAEETRRFVHHCLAEDLLITVGSDDHGRPGDVKHRPLGSTKFKSRHLIPFLERFGIRS